MPHPNYSKTYVASGDVRPCRIVKANTSADFGCTEADANEVGIGISREGTRAFDSANAAVAADHLLVFVEGAECLLELGSGGATAGAYLKSDADGKGVLVATSGTTEQNIVARAEEAGAEGAKIRVTVMIRARYPAIA